MPRSTVLEVDAGKRSTNCRTPACGLLPGLPSENCISQLFTETQLSHPQLSSQPQMSIPT